MNANIARQRLVNQQIAQPLVKQPDDVVHWLGAVQAQDYLGALWAVGLRLPNATEATVEQAIAEKKIIRTWPMRGTIHFIAPSDARWMLELLTPRVVQQAQGRMRQFEIDSQVLVASAKAITHALEGGKQLTRPQLYEVLAAAGIATNDSRGLHILGQLAHAQLICFGARSGKQPTFVLFDEWVLPAPPLVREQALSMLAQRYFSSHGPATVQDFVWWAGLTVADATVGISNAVPKLGHEMINNKTYYFAHNQHAPTETVNHVFLLPPFDEFLVAYRDRSAVLDPDYNTWIVPGSNGMFSPIVVVDGQVVGTWKRTLKNSTVEFDWNLFPSWDAARTPELYAAAERYAAFVGKGVAVQHQ